MAHIATPARPAVTAFGGHHIGEKIRGPLLVTHAWRCATPPAAAAAGPRDPGPVELQERFITLAAAAAVPDFTASGMSKPMKIAVVIDGCAWNKLFYDNVDLAEVFPHNKYSLFVTREVEIELLAIPPMGKDSKDNRKLKAYIADSIATHRVQTTSVFGFASVEPDGSLSEVQVYGGFNQGTWQSEADRQWYASDEVKSLVSNKRTKNSGLTDNQADASLAVRSFESIVLTNEAKKKSGPLRLAAEHGGRVVYLADIKESQLLLKDYITKLTVTRIALESRRMDRPKSSASWAMARFHST